MKITTSLTTINKEIYMTRREVCVEYKKPSIENWHPETTDTMLNKNKIPYTMDYYSTPTSLIYIYWWESEEEKYCKSIQYEKES